MLPNSLVSARESQRQRGGEKPTGWRGPSIRWIPWKHPPSFCVR